MRLGIVVALLAGCVHPYDPVAELDHDEVPDARAAIDEILPQIPGARVFAIGEYHPVGAAQIEGSPLRRFSSEILAELAPHAHHLVVEAWLADGCRSTQSVEAQVAAATQRAPGTVQSIAQLVTATKAHRLSPHGLEMTCIEHGALLDGHGRVDFLRLLELVTDKLRDTARAYAGDGGVIVYGGALHNDLYPRWRLDGLSYAAPLAKELGPGRVVEIDLVQPEIVAPLALVRIEPWFPLLARASPDRAIVWRRAADSYVIILPAQSEAVAKVAMPVAQM